MICGLGEYNASQAVEHASWGVSDKNRFYRILEEAAWKQGMIDNDVSDFLKKLVGSIF